VSTLSITIDMPAEELDAIKKLTRVDGDGDAILRAAREYVRLVRLRELKSASGKLDVDENWQRLEDLERGETTFPE
jgi:hypothetical protein